MKKINKESQSQQARRYSLSVKNLRILEHTPKQNSQKRIFQSFGCLQMGTNENRSKLRSIRPIWRNKKGWLRIIEAFIAILIITGGVLVVLSKKSIDNNSLDRVYEKQKYLLDIIIKDDTSREYILQEDTGNLNSIIQNMIPNNWNFTISICEISDICNNPDPPAPKDKEVYATEIIVTSTLNEYNPKKLRFFVWMK